MHNAWFTSQLQKSKQGIFKCTETSRVVHNIKPQQKINIVVYIYIRIPTVHAFPLWCGI